MPTAASVIGARYGMHEELVSLGYSGSYGRVAAFAVSVIQHPLDLNQLRGHAYNQLE